MANPTTTPMVVAHRGASKAQRENTLAAFLAARELGAAMVELDVRRTADGVLVVHHDPATHEAGGDRVIARTLAADLPPHVPTLHDALEACAGMEVNVEIKCLPGEPDHDPSLAVVEQTVELLLARGDAHRMLVSSFDRSAIERVHKLEPGLRTGFLYSVPSFPPLPPVGDEATIVREMADAGHVALHPHRRAVTPLLCRLAHERGMAVNVWTVDDPDEMRALASAGVDAIITNVPDVARAALGIV